MSSVTPSPKWPHRPATASAPRRLPRTPAARQAGIVTDFKQAREARDIDAIIGLLDPGVRMTAGGGGLVSSVLRPIDGGEQIALHGRYRQQGT